MVSAADRAKQPLRTSVWLEGKPAARSRKSERSDHPTGLGRDRIIAVSVRLLDEEGPAKFSMRRLAAELGVTAMSLYWYVDTKDDLLELALDSVFAEVRVPESEGADWRCQLRALADNFRAVLVRHHWVSPLVGRFLNIGPHATAFSLALQRVMRGTGLPARGRAGALAAVFQFVYGFGTVEGHYVQRCAEAGMTQEQYYRRAMGMIDEQPELRRSLQQADETLEAPGGETVEEMRERDFVFALELLIAGIEAMRARA